MSIRVKYKDLDGVVRIVTVRDERVKTKEDLRDYLCGKIDNDAATRKAQESEEDEGPTTDKMIAECYREDCWGRPGKKGGGGEGTGERKDMKTLQKRIRAYGRGEGNWNDNL